MKEAQEMSLVLDPDCKDGYLSSLVGLGSLHTAWTRVRDERNKK